MVVGLCSSNKSRSDDKTVSINSLIPHGPSQSYMYSKYPVTESLTIINPRTSYGRIYTISKEQTMQGSITTVKV